jgi:predicted membrane GTPase involved in stress response
MEIITPKEYVGTLMELAQARRGEFLDMTYLTETRTTLIYNLPLAEVRLLFRRSLVMVIRFLHVTMAIDASPCLLFDVFTIADVCCCIAGGH